MTTTTKPTTAEELFAMGDIGRCELIRGEIRHMSPAGFQHGTISQRLARSISSHVERNHLGEVTAAETGFTIARNPDTVRAPDVGFVSARRLPTSPVTGFFPGAPDLAVEVISPSDTASEVALKVEEWLAAGTTSVWVVDPKSRSIVVHRGGIEAFHYRMGDTLRSEPTLPGFELEVRSLFES
jgi:Uma2 family endonuclease